MEEGLVHDIKRLRILTPSFCDNMDGLVPDLCSALEETSCNRTSAVKSIKKERPWKRRFRPGSSRTFCNGEATVKSSAVSEDSDSSLDDKINFRLKGCGSHPQSDSDDMNPKWHHQHLQSWRRATNMVESDSVNENFHPAREHKRKRKFKRMVVDPQPDVKNELLVAKYLLTIPSKTSECLKKSENTEKISNSPSDLETIRGRGVQVQKIFSGKRKRSIREKSIECNFAEKKSNFMPHHSVLNSHDLSSNNQFMDCDSIEEHNFQCSSGLSSSDSDNGFVTNDEGREADDEHSDVNPSSLISPDLQHSFHYLSACEKIQTSSVSHLMEHWESDVLHSLICKEQSDIFKPEHMQVESSLSRTILRCEGTKRRRRTPPNTYFYGESALDVNNSSYIVHCRDSHTVFGTYDGGMKLSSKISSRVRRKNFYGIPCDSRQSHNSVRPHSCIVNSITSVPETGNNLHSSENLKQDCKGKSDDNVTR